MAKLIKTDGSIENVTPRDGEMFELKELQGYVHGYIQLLPLNSKTYMVVDEEAKLKNSKFNKKATDIFAQYLPAGVVFSVFDYIYGDVLICSNKEMR